MKPYLFITIDTEEDLWGGYTVENPPVMNIKNIPMLQKIFEKYSAIPTYLINYPVATNEYAIRLFKELHDQGKCDIGTHCHPWNTPPFNDNKQGVENSFMSNLPENTVFEKMSVLHNAIVEKIDFTPIVFRAGRWGIGEKVVKAIHSLGYRIDTSITPFQNWNDDSGPIFNLKTNMPYGLNGMERLCLKAENCGVCDQSNECVIEIPPTIGFLQENFTLCQFMRKIFGHYPFSKLPILGVLNRLKILNHRVLSPELSAADDMIKLSRTMINKGYRFLNMSFHSTSLLPGKSPFVKNNRDLENFLGKIEHYLDFIAQNNISCIGMSHALEVMS